MVISGHTHQPYVCNIHDPAGKPRLVTSASSFGRLFTETDLKYDKTHPRHRARVRQRLEHGRHPRRPKDAGADRADHHVQDAGHADRQQGHRAHHRRRHRAGNPAGESPLGDLIADAQLADPSTTTDGKVPVVAFMNPGGVRADLVYNASSPERDPWARHLRGGKRLVSCRHRMSGCSSTSSRSTSAGARAHRIDVPGGDLEFCHGEDWRPALRWSGRPFSRLPGAVTKGPRSGGMERGPTKRSSRKAIAATPGNRGKPRVDAATCIPI